MSKTLIIVEAPSKAAHIQKFLGPNFIVKASIGHITEMPIPSKMTAEEKQKYSEYAQEVNNSFNPLFKVSSDKKKVVAELKRILKTVDECILATDSDAEGAAIAYHLLQELQPKVPTFRATWNEITDKAVREGLKNKKLINVAKQEPKDFFGQAESAITRAQWDRLYGYGSTSYIWRAVKSGTSSGRVQTPGTLLVVEREEKRLAFVSVSFYTIWGDFEGTKAKLTEFNGKKIADGSKIDDEGLVKDGYTLITDENLSEILSELKKKDYAVSDVSSKPYRRVPPAPFTTSTALQSIGAKTRQSVKQITKYFQELYSSDAAVTYIRTVSVVSAPEAVAEARKEITRLFGAKFIPGSPRVYTDKKSGNSGHECLRPVLDDNSGKIVNPKFGDPKKQQIFDLIRLRFLASQSIDCEGLTWTAKIDATDGNARFSASETEIHEPGWTTIYQLDEEVGA